MQGYFYVVQRDRPEINMWLELYFFKTTTIPWPYIFPGNFLLSSMGISYGGNIFCTKWHAIYVLYGSVFSDISFMPSMFYVAF